MFLIHRDSRGTDPTRNAHLCRRLVPVKLHHLRNPLPETFGLVAKKERLRRKIKKAATITRLFDDRNISALMAFTFCSFHRTFWKLSLPAFVGRNDNLSEYRLCTLSPLGAGVVKRRM